MAGALPDDQPNADGPMHVDTSVTIAAPIDVVWATLNDLGSYGDWNPYIVGIVGTGEPGTTVAVTARPGGADESMTYDVDVVSVDPPRQLRWNGGFPDRAQWNADHRWDLSENDHHTVVRHHEYFSGTLAAEIHRANSERVHSDFTIFNEALKAESERRFTAG